MVKMADHNRMQMVWMPGHMEIYGNETADQVARKASHIHSYNLRLPLELLYKGSQGRNQGVDKYETLGALAVHLWIKAAYRIS